MITAATREEIEWVCDQIGYSPSKNAKGVVIHGKEQIGAAAIYDHWTHTAVQMHAYSRGPKYVLNPHFCRAMFEYPFVQCNKMLAFAVTPCDNSASLALAQYLGFKEVYRIENGWDSGTAMVIQELRRENCRFLELTDGNRERVRDADSESAERLDS